MKRKIMCIFVLFLSFFIAFGSVSAKTIRDLKNDLQKLKNEQAEKEANANAIQEKINQVMAEIESIGNQIEEAKKDEENTKKEIEDLKIKIDQKKEEIKDLVIFYQMSNNKNFYLEYVFGADNFTDLIYRISITQQLIASNDELVGEMTVLIDENNKKLEELKKTQEKLEALNKEAERKINSLGSEKEAIMDEAESYDSQIANLEKQIKNYESQGCGIDQQLNDCLGSYVPQSYNGFISPLRSGYVSDNFGWRYLPEMGGSKYDTGSNLAGNNEGTGIKAAADGWVSRIITYPDSGWDAYHCGGQQIFINHIVSGVYYTTIYKHMLNIYVKQGDTVYQGQIIGTQGGGSTSRYDGCTFGTHLHLSVAKGHYYGTGANSYTYNLTDHLIEPRDVINYPAYGKWFNW